MLSRVGDTGVLQGAHFGLGKRLGAQDRQFNILAASVIGSMADRFAHHGLPVDALVQPIHFGKPLPTVATASNELQGAYHTEVAERAAGSVPHPYEAREDDDGYELDRVAIVGRMDGRWFVAVCIVDGEGQTHGMIGRRGFASARAARNAFASQH